MQQTSNNNNNNNSNKMMETKSRSSGITQIWKFWRHCCCRFGLYPLLVAPLITASCLLDLYSSWDCEFLNVNVGFRPSNQSWNQTTATLGLFQFQADEASNVWGEILVEGCNRYSDEFHEQFIDGDRTWEVAQVVAYISGISGIIATATSWMLVISPLPVCLFWPGVLLPSILVAFLSEGSKFLFLDTAVCQSSIWYPSGADSLPQSANSCTIGKSAYFSIAAGVCFFVCLLLVCFRSPEKRQLDEDFGEANAYIASDNILDTSMEGEEFDQDNDIELNLSNIQPEVSFVVVQNHEERDYASSLGDEGRSFEFSQFSVVENDSFFDNMDKSILGEGAGQGHDSLESESSAKNGSFEKRDDSTNELISNPSSADSDDPKNPKKPAPVKAVEDPPKGTRVVSQARLEKAEDMALQTINSSDKLIDQCVMDLTKSFQTENVENCETSEN
eukprot:CAMPEP_0119022060 /NCGR_PEP_ID=MMETSP1176-20130426/27224_1 /TAXON_ID=265551 /ORGANISM="Synedropsis recta cf, Strain CCMP1620" /LENGTH=445 /DNA_ID=CAMNT_0006976801 /DNA_START=37 /DNA_END=1374 /DNA_ORIENTATION=+